MGTISPVNSENFMGGIWETRGNNDPIPTILVWGTGSESNATVEIPKNEAGQRQIAIYDQGVNHEPNGTMAIMHYPLNPKAQWSFDIHESLFDDATQSAFSHRLHGIILSSRNLITIGVLMRRMELQLLIPKALQV